MTVGVFCFGRIAVVETFCGSNGQKEVQTTYSFFNEDFLWRKIGFSDKFKVRLFFKEF